MKRPSKPSRIDLADNLAYQLVDLTQAYRSYFDKKMAKLELDRSQWPLLVNLWYVEGTTQQELADILDMTRGGMNKLIDRLEKAGLVRRAEGLDGRTKRVFIVDEHRPLVAEIDRVQREMVQASISVLSATEASTLKRLLKKVREGLNDLP